MIIPPPVPLVAAAHWLVLIGVGVVVALYDIGDLVRLLLLR